MDLVVSDLRLDPSFYSRGCNKSLKRDKRRHITSLYFENSSLNFFVRHLCRPRKIITLTIMKTADTHISAILRPSYDGHERFNKYTVLIKSSAVMNLHLTLLSELNDLFYHISIIYLIINTCILCVNIRKNKINEMSTL